jgi:hypothetical protein
MRKISSVIFTVNDLRTNEARVYRDVENNEYRVKFYVNGVHQKDADYFTDDKQDAFNTADAWVVSNY